jgi:DtxR family transcriptional regulator, Mn-dependent transcriptional regulator
LLPNIKNLLIVKKYLDLPKNIFLLMAILSVAEQNYLKAIYHLAQPAKMVNTNALANALQVKASTATDMLKKLEQKKWLHYTPYKGFKLTDKGVKQALLIIRRHRLWEFFLVKKLGISWSAVHNLAEELEHIDSPLLIDSLAAYLNNPTYDPHGDPIPNAQGELPHNNWVALHTINKPAKVRVEAVINDSEACLDLFTKLGLQIGKNIQIINFYDFDSSLQVKNNQQLITISHVMAQQILVTNLSKISHG